MALDRSMLAFIKELRICAGRPFAKGTQVMRADDAVAEREAAVEAGAASEIVPETPVEIAAVEAAVIEDPVASAAAASALAKPARGVTEPVVSMAASVAQARVEGESVVMAKNGAGAGKARTPEPEAPFMELEPLDAAGEEHMAAFQDAFRGLAETLEEARALDQARTAGSEPVAVTASGD